MDVSISLNLSSNSDWLSIRPEQMPSSYGIQDLKRWQFCSSTHLPSLEPLSMASAALASCPCPRLIMSSLSSYLHRLAYYSTCHVGSTPWLSTNIMGVAESAAEKREGIELIGLWAYSEPSSSSRYLSTPNIIFSGLKIFITSSLSNGVRVLERPQGIDE